MTITLFLTKIVTEYIIFKADTEMKKVFIQNHTVLVVFKDMSNGDMFLSKLTVATKETTSNSKAKHIRC